MWLSQGEIAELYGTSLPNVVQIVRRVLSDGEVSEATLDSELRVAQEGRRQVRRQVKVCSLDLILAVGYRVSSPRAVHFRQWATTVLREYLVTGFALDDARLRDGSADYFDELLARIRDIRASAKRFYQKVRDLLAATSADYDGTSATARTFFATIQNKLIFAITGRTAAELVVERADPSSPTLGLATWESAGAQGRRRRREELSPGEGGGRAQPVDHPLPRLRRGPHGGRRARESEDSAIAEADDLRALLEIERRDDPS